PAPAPASAPATRPAEPRLRPLLAAMSRRAGLAAASAGRLTASAASAGRLLASRLPRDLPRIRVTRVAGAQQDGRGPRAPDGTAPPQTPPEARSPAPSAGKTVQTPAGALPAAPVAADPLPAGWQPGAPLPLPLMRRRGRAALRLPRRLWSGQAETARLGLATDHGLRRRLHAALARSNPDALAAATAWGEPAALRLTARLESDPARLRIEPLGPATRSDRDARLDWSWRLRPVGEGHGLVTLRVALEATGGAGGPTAVESAPLTLSVEVAPPSPWTPASRLLHRALDRLTGD
ncbi:MAG: hypothetical protein AAFZ09_16530, partial [Pseudomonadota bacterium]